MFYAAYFTAVVIFAGQRVKKVWITPIKVFAWNPASLPISRPSAPLEILGHGATMVQVRQRETWANPQHDRGTSSPKLPPLPTPPVPPVPPLPAGAKDLHPGQTYPGQTYPGQKLRRGALPAIPVTDLAQPDFPQDVSSLDLKTPAAKSRPLTMMSGSSRYSPSMEPLKLKGHSKGAVSHDTGAARYAQVTRQTSMRGRGDWMTPGFTYGREYVERALSPQPSLPSSPRAGLPAHKRQPSINSYRNSPSDSRYPNFF